MPRVSSFNIFPSFHFQPPVHIPVKRRKFIGIFIAALSLALLTALRNTTLVGEVYPTSVGEYEAAKGKHASLVCPCENSNIALKNFATLKTTPNPVCDWLENDFAAGEKKSACFISESEMGALTACKNTMSACRDSVVMTKWALARFNDTVLTSSEVKPTRYIAESANASWADTFELSKIIISASTKEVESWAAGNMPKVLEVMSDVVSRTQGLGAKLNGVTGVTKDAVIEKFKTSCTAAHPSCNWSDLADGSCNQHCKNAECFYDGGDCAGLGLEESENWNTYLPYFTLTEPKGLTYSNDNVPSWLSVPSSAFVDSGLISCNGSTWNQAIRQPLYDWDGYNERFQYESGWAFPKLDSNDPELRDMISQNNWESIIEIIKGYPKITFKLAGYQGCDYYSRSLRVNQFAAQEGSEDFEKLKEYVDTWFTFYTKYIDADRALPQENWYYDTDEKARKQKEYLSSINEVLLKFFFPIQRGKRSNNLGELKQNLFLDDIEISTDYDKYFEACDVKRCTYTYEADVSAATLASIILGLIGGVTTVMGLLARILYNILKYSIIYRREDDVTHTDFNNAPDAAKDPKAVAKETQAV